MSNDPGTLEEPKNTREEAVYDAGKIIALDAIKNRQEACKQLLAIAVTAIAAYVALLGQADGKPKNLVQILPIVFFISAAGTYLRGYLPPYRKPPSNPIQPSKLGFFAQIDSDLIEAELTQIYEHTIKYLVRGGYFFAVGVFSALAIIWQPPIKTDEPKKPPKPPVTATPKKTPKPNPKKTPKPPG